MTDRPRTPRGWDAIHKPGDGGWIPKQRGTDEPLAPPAKPWESAKRWSK